MTRRLSEHSNMMMKVQVKSKREEIKQSTVITSPFAKALYSVLYFGSGQFEAVYVHISVLMCCLFTKPLCFSSAGDFEIAILYCNQYLDRSDFSI